MTKIERELKRRERRRMADLNRNSEEVFRSMVRTTVVGMMLLAGIIILLLASAVRADQEAFASTIRRTRLIREELTELGEDREYLHVPPLPEFPPVDGEPPQAIEVVSKMEIVEAETIPEERWESLGTYKLTFYCACRKCSGKWGHRTSSGATCEEGTTVACAVLPAGTHVWIEGYGERIVQDTGAGVKGKHIDIFMESHNECLKNGVQYKEVRIRK